MAASPRLTPEQWAAARRRWEGCDAPGFDWLAREVVAAFEVAVSRQAIAKCAGKNEWKKGGEPSAPLVAQPSSETGKVAQPASTVAQPEAREKLGGDARPRELIASRKVADETGLTPPQEAFALAVAKGLNLSDAYRAAYPKALNWKPETVHKEASLLAAHPKVGPRIQELLTEAAANNGADITLVLKQYLARLNADPRELTEVRVVPCRYCYGSSHRYQFTDGELEDERDKHEDKRQAKLDAGGADIGDFNEKGGGGYTVLKEPSPTCPSCGGAGSSRVVLKDSRTFSPAALALFGGVKQTKEGIEVKLTDRVDVLGHVARHVGFFEADNKLDVDVSVDMASLDAFFDHALAKAKEGEQEARGRMDRLRNKGVKVD